MIHYLSGKNMAFLLNYEADLLNRTELVLQEGSDDDLEAENDCIWTLKIYELKLDSILKLHFHFCILSNLFEKKLTERAKTWKKHSI